MKRHGGSIRPRTIAALVVIGLLGAVAVPVVTTAAAGAVPDTLHGRVDGLGVPLPDFTVTLYAAGSALGVAPTLLTSTTSGPLGLFDLDYTPPTDPDAVLYVLATGPDPSVTLATVLGRGPFPSEAVLNERTTVAAGFSLAQFTSGGEVSGPSPGLPNAAGMADNIAAVPTGGFSPVLLTTPNVTTSTTDTVNSLSNVVAACVDSPAGCAALFVAATPPNGPAPTNTFQAMADVAANPTQTDNALYDLTSGPWATYAPTLQPAPESWTIPIRFDGDGKSLDGPGNIAVDHEGFLWVNNNYEYSPSAFAQVCGADNVFKFTPTGQFVEGTPYTGGGLSGAGFGIDIDVFGDVWVGNYGFAAPGCVDKPPHNTVSQFRPDGAPVSPDSGWDAGGMSWPQATVSDSQGNIWIANCGNGSVTRYPRGDHNRAEQYTDLGIEKPFAVAFNNDGQAFVTGTQSNTIAMLDPDGTPVPGSPISSPILDRPMGAAANSKGDIWIANAAISPPPCGDPFIPDSAGGSVALIRADGTPAFVSPKSVGGLTWAWGIVVDGVDNVWVTNFAGKRISQFCGRDDSPHCPPGAAAGTPISPDSGYAFDGLTRNTGLAVDPSGNVWVMNNWRDIPIQANPGGYQIVAYVGVAAPVQRAAPIPRPVPTTTTTMTTAAALPVPLQPTFTG